MAIEDSRVYGEVYEVDEEAKERMDRLESVGYEYDCIEVTVHFKDHEEKVLFYVYLRDVSGMELCRLSDKWQEQIKRPDSHGIQESGPKES